VIGSPTSGHIVHPNPREKLMLYLKGRAMKVKDLPEDDLSVGEEMDGARTNQ